MIDVPVLDLVPGDVAEFVVDGEPETATIREVTVADTSEGPVAQVHAVDGEVYSIHGFALDATVTVIERAP